MKIFFQCKLILLISSFALTSLAQADNLGRIFTSEHERQKLEKIRLIKSEPRKIEIIDVQKIEKPLAPEKELVIREAITLKGLVHRGKGKNTAWVNDSNTFDGDLDSHFIQVPDDKIKSDQVTIIMPDDSTHVELKVGEAFTPAPIERDIVETANDR